MPQLQALTLTDRQASPVAHTFQPEGISQNVGSVVENKDVPIGNPRYSLSLRQTEKAYKGTLKFAVPIVVSQVINGVSTPVVARTSYVNCEFEFAKTSTEQERKDVVGMFQSSLAPGAVLVNDTLVKLQGVY